MASPGLRKSYRVEASHGEVYTGGPVAYHAGFRSLITPQEGRINTLPLHNSGVYVFPIAGVRNEKRDGGREDFGSKHSSPEGIGVD